MAGEKKARSSKQPQVKSGGVGAGDNGGINWTNPQPTTSDAEWLEGDSYDAGELINRLLEGLGEKDKVSCKYDTHSNRYLASLLVSPRDNSRPVEALSVRGATAFDALLLLAYFDVVRFEGLWAQQSVSPTSRFG